MSLFLHLEDALEDQNENLRVGTLDESETATAEIAELRQEEAAVVEADRAVEDLEERVELAEDLAEEVEPVVAEGHGYDKAGMAILLTGLRAVAGKRAAHLVGRKVRMESIDAGPSGRAEQTAIVFEDLRDTLKSAWAAIKQAFKKAWAQIKNWYIKTFDSSKALRKRAESIRNKAEQQTGSIDNKTFKFSSAKTIAVDGGVKDAGKIVASIETLKDLTDKILDKTDSDKVNKDAGDLAELLDLVKADDLDNAISGIDVAIVKDSGVKGLNGSVTDNNVKAGLGDAREIDTEASAVLPGGKIVVNVKGKGGTTTGEKIAKIRRTRTVLINAVHKPKEVSEDVTTATASQVANLCDKVLDISDIIFDFKKGWEARDKAQDQLISTIDKAFSKIGNEKEDTTAGQRNARGLASAATGLLRRDSSFKTQYIGYVMNVANVALSYGEGSLRQHKK